MDTSLEERRDAQREEQLVTRQHVGGVTTLTLNRPQQYNALSRAMLAALQGALDEVAGDAGTRVE